jgi:4-hydroxybenzoate polyprenyltransferase
MSDFSNNSNSPPEADRSPAAGSFSALVRLLRPRHWVKNLLLVAPILLAHEFTDTRRLLPLLLGIISFSLIASLVYVVNDLVDIESDRHHPQKRFRPLAAGDLSRTSGVLVALVLAAGGIAAALAVSTNFLVITAVYLATTTLYSIWLKRVVIADVLMLASFYTLRILAGGIAASLEEPVSPWLLAFAMFLFTSLAFSKRHAELTRLANEQPESTDRSAAGRGYRVRDLGIIEVLGPTSGYLSVLVFTLYINREGIDQLYTYTWPLWTITLLLMYWISRLWLLARRGELKEDPVVFAVTDPVSLLVGLLVTGLAIVAAAPWVVSG